MPLIVVYHLYTTRYKTQRINPKDFRNCKYLIELMKHLTGGNTNPKEVLKDQNWILWISSKQNKIKWIKKSKPKDQINVIQNV